MRATFITALSLTFISLVFSQLTAGGQHAQQSKPPSAAWPNTGSMTAGLNPSSFQMTAPTTSPLVQSGQEGQLTPQMLRDIMNNLRQRYPPVLSNLRGLRLECKPDVKDTIRKAIEPATGWLKSVDQLSLINRLSPEDITSEETESLIRDRVSAEGLSGRDYENRVRALTRSGIVVTETELRKIERDRLRRDGYNDQEIEEALKDADAVRAEFQKMYDDLKGLIWKTLEKAYDKAHECCMKESKDFYLGMMDGLGRELTIGGQADKVSMEKRNECLCAIESVSARGSGAWTGEITHTENFVDERIDTVSSGGSTRHDEYYKKHDYRAVINLVYFTRSLVAGEDGSRIPAQMSVSGSVEQRSAIYNRWTSTSMDKRQGRESKEEYSGKINGEETNVEVRIRPDGTYSVFYIAPCAEGSGTDFDRSYTEGTGFPEFQKKNKPQSRKINRNVCPTATGVLLSDGQHVGITGKIDPKDPKTLSGSKTFEVPLGGPSKVNKTITITWNLKRCK